MSKIYLFLILIIFSCKKEDDITLPYAHVKFTIQGNTPPDFSYDPKPLAGVSDPDMYFSSGTNPDLFASIPSQSYYYRLRLLFPDKSVGEYPLGKSYPDFEIRLKIGDLLLESESGTVEIEKCEDQESTYNLVYDLKGTFNGTFYDEDHPQNIYIINGSWDIDL